MYEKRNMMVGDVVLVHYASKSKPGSYRLARVVAVETDKDDLVRICVEEIKLQGGMECYAEEVPVVPGGKRRKDARGEEEGKRVDDQEEALHADASNAEAEDVRG